MKVIEEKNRQWPWWVGRNATCSNCESTIQFEAEDSVAYRPEGGDYEKLDFELQWTCVNCRHVNETPEAEVKFVNE